MDLKKKLSIISVITICAFLCLAFTQMSQKTDTPTEAKSLMDKQKATEALLKKAENYIKEQGKEKAFAEFDKSDGQFTMGSAYITAIDYQGNMLADGSVPNLVGQNVYAVKSIDGKEVTQELIKKARDGGGWLVYHWVNPINNVMECKRTLVKPMEGYFIATGYYYRPPIANDNALNSISVDIECEPKQP